MDTSVFPCQKTKMKEMSQIWWLERRTDIVKDIEKKKGGGGALWCVLDRIKIPTKVNKVIIIYSKTSEYSGHTELLTQSFLLSSYSGLKSGLEIDRNFIYTILPNFQLCKMQNKSSEINAKIHSCFWDIMAYTDIPLECYSPSAWRCKLWK